MVCDNSKKQTLNLKKGVVGVNSNTNSGIIIKNNNNEEFVDIDGKLPIKRPPFTVGQLKRAIPPHCFKPTYFKSLQYLIFDFVLAAILIAAYAYLSTISTNWIYQITLLTAYTIAQGSTYFAIWVLAHECGHQAFAPTQRGNDTIGFILHSMLLVPYFSWKFSHAKHHRSTGDVDRDEVFVPSTDESSSNPTKFEIVLELLITLLIGWPSYLLFNVSGRDYGDVHVDHFNPNSPIFNKNQRKLIMLSDIGVIAWLAVLSYASFYLFTPMIVLKYYFLPWIVVNAFLTTYTKLHHTDKKVPHFRGKDWNWLQGALCTIDRDWGIFNFLHHDIGDTHVVHHLFSRIPHYHCHEANEAIKPILGSYYYRDDSNIFLTLIKVIVECRYVDKNGGVLFYKS